MSKANNKVLKNIWQERTHFIANSWSRMQITKRAGAKLAKEIFDGVMPVERYNETRYLIDDIKKYANKTTNNDLFFELLSGQGSFLPPISKNKQGMLFIKK